MHHGQGFGDMGAAVGTFEHVFRISTGFFPMKDLVGGKLVTDKPDQEPDDQEQQQQAKEHIIRIKNYWLLALQPIVYDF